MEKNSKNIDIDIEVKNFILSNEGNFRLCTTCSGPAILPVSIKKPKDSDIIIDISPQKKLYVSKVQARYLRHIDRHMIGYY